MDINEYETQVKIYNDDIDLYLNEYIDSLSDQSLIYKPMVFNGLLQYIYKHCFDIQSDNIYKNHSNIDYNNTYILSYLIDKYLLINYQYNHIPSLLGFSLFSGISNATLNDWLNGRYRNNTESLISVDGMDKPLSHIQSVKRLKDMCELALVSNTAETNSVGSLFLLKANYGYSDQPTTQVLPDRKEPLPAIEDVEQRYLKPPKLD